MIIEWRKTPDKEEVIKSIHALLFKEKEKIVQQKKDKKIASHR